MTYIISALAVYKILHIAQALLVRDVMPWVKVVTGALVSFLAVGLAGGQKSVGMFVLSSLAVATLSGTAHSVIRLLTYLGDMAARKSVK